MESHYEINVSLNGRHFFATAPRSGINKKDAKKIYEEIEARFPQREGFEVNVTYYEIGGCVVTWNS
jgi:hypothetical protein